MKFSRMFIVSLIVSFLILLFLSCASDINTKSDKKAAGIQNLSVPEDGFSIKNGKLVDGFGNPFVMRGVNHAHTWYATFLEKVLPPLNNLGANTVRLVMSSGKQWLKTSPSQVTRLIEQSKKNKLIAVLEVHDTTGFGEKAEAASIPETVEYWISLKDVLAGEEAYAIINIGNEPYGNRTEGELWINEHIDAVIALRQAGFRHTIMIDAPSWGQDSGRVMLENAHKIFDADPLANVMFSVHMYQVYADRDIIDNYLTAFIENGLCLIVGEFGPAHYGQNVDEASILELCTQYGTGYLGWSWCGNSSDVADLDLTENWRPDRLTVWGDFLFNSEFGIKNTSEICTVFTTFSE